MMTPRPILAALRSHRIAALLIVLEIALAFAIVSNAVYLVAGRLDRMNLLSGVDVRDLVVIQRSSATPGSGNVASAAGDLAALRAIPGVRAASASNQVPYTNSSWNSGYQLQPGRRADSVIATVYLGGPQLMRTLGVRLLQGRGFSTADYVNLTSSNNMTQFFQPPGLIVSRAYAERLWPGQSALGKVLYADTAPIRVVGVMSNIIAPQVRAAGDARNYYAVLAPFRVGPELGASYLLRTTPQQRERVLKTAIATLRARHPDETITQHYTLAGKQREYFANDRAMAWLLVGTVLALLAVTAVGIVGLASFWVQQRTRQIGMRRALGATRGDILRYFQTENFLLATLGIVLGCAAAIGINVWLMAHYAVPRLPVMYLPIGALALWLLGQLAVLGPALRAARVPPTVAMRSA